MSSLIKYLVLTFILTIGLGNHFLFAQGFNHNWLIGYTTGIGIDTNVTSTKARLQFDLNNVSILPETRKMSFRAAQGNISDENGNLIIVSNGCWIANATGDTLMNGAGLNTGQMSGNGWCGTTTGIPIPHGNIVLPFPGDSNKFILYHQTETELLYSIIDINLDGGLGGVTTKNVSIIQDSLNFGFSACKHANGRDWWIVAMRNSSTLVYKILVTPDTIATITTQQLNPPMTYFSAGQPTFSPDGTKFAYTAGYGGPNGWHDVRVFDFDRCSGNLDSLTYVYNALGMGFGIAFSSNSQYLYHSSFSRIYQVDLNTHINNLVAINDGYYSPSPPFQSDFWLMYLAANGKIYITSGNGVVDFHYINYPDSVSFLCDVQQHALHIPCYSGRGNVNHPNYYLGAADGTVCDSLGLNPVDEGVVLDQSFKIRPNPTNGNFSIIYLLPQNRDGLFEVYDISGRRVYAQVLPTWSSLQSVQLENLRDGIYQAVITSGGYRVAKKVVILNE